MIKEIDNLSILGEMINSRAPAEVKYRLGEGPKKTYLTLTYVQGDTVLSNRITSDLLIKLGMKGEGPSMEITDKERNIHYSGLKPQGAVYEKPNHQDELGDLEVDLGEGAKLGFSHFKKGPDRWVDRGDASRN